MISRSTEKFPTSCCGLQSGNERALLSLSFLTLAASLYVHILLVWTPAWLFQVFPVFFINLENSKSVLFSGMCMELLLFTFVLLLFLHCQVTSIMTEVISDGCRERKKVNGELSCLSIQSNENEMIWKNCQPFSSFITFCPSYFQLNNISLNICI